MESEQTQPKPHGENTLLEQINQTEQVDQSNTHKQGLEQEQIENEEQEKQGMSVDELVAEIIDIVDEEATVAAMKDIAKILRYVVEPTEEHDVKQRLINIITMLSDAAGISSVDGIPLRELLNRVKKMKDREASWWLEQIISDIQDLYEKLVRSVRGNIIINYEFVPEYLYDAVTPRFLCELIGHDNAYTPNVDENGNVECDRENDDVVDDIEEIIDEIDDIDDDYDE